MPCWSSQSMPAAESVHILVTRSLLFQSWPPVIVSEMNRSTVSVAASPPAACWYLVPAAFMPELEKLVQPPTMALFSSRATFLAPDSRAEMAAHMPAPPMPRTTTS